MSKTDFELMRHYVDTLNAASKKYYNGEESMGNYEWDKLFDELVELEKKTKVVFPDSPTMNVFADDTVGQKVKHEFPALSLAKSKKVRDMVDWTGGRNVWISLKLDGLTCVVTYDDGKLTKVVTRGDGYVGTDVTHLAGAIGGIPKQIDVPKGTHLVVRGETLISYKDFDQFCMESGENYANPRNLAAGSLNLKDVEEVKKRHLTWIPFNLVSYNGDDNLRSWGARMDWLTDHGMNVVPNEKSTAAELPKKLEQWSNKFSEFGLPVDGLVIAYNDTDYARGGSVTGHHAIREGYAFKWADETKTSTLREIEWSCAANCITPVAIFDPVELEGTTVKRANLCNISECERLGIGGEGTQVVIAKMNKIIPKVVEVEQTVGELIHPKHCPVCGGKTIIKVSTSRVKTLVCTNENCAGKKLKIFSRFASKEGMDLDGISEATIQTFIDRGWLKEVSDFYTVLPSKQKEIASLDGFGAVSAKNILAAIEKSRKVEPKNFLYALAIPMVGKEVIKRVLKKYDIHKLLDILFDPLTNKLFFAKINGIGVEKSSALVSWFKTKENVESVEKLLELIIFDEPEEVAAGVKCNGLTFVITGDVRLYKNRNELKSYIESQGGKVTGSVTAKTSFLINNDKESSSGKNKKAKELGTPIISEQDFVDRFGGD